MIKQCLDYKKKAKKVIELQNLKNILYFLIESCEEKAKKSKNNDSKDVKIDRAVLCFIWNESLEGEFKSFLPWFHAAHTNCLKTKLMRDPLQYPCSIWKMNPNENEEIDPMSYLDNLFDDKFLKEFGERKSEAIINKHLKHWGLCSAPFILEPSEPNYEEKTEDGSFISMKAADCKASRRFKCPSCRNESCINCNASPYHNFLTCEEYLKSQQTVKWRYWNSDILDMTDAKKDMTGHICWNREECRKYNKWACQEILECGHLCNGSKMSKEHMVCLHPECVHKNPDATLGVDKEQGCLIWMIEYKSRPCVILKCKHIYDVDCLYSRLQSKWSGANVNFEHLNWFCNAPIETDHEEIQRMIEEDRKFQEKAEEVAIAAAIKDQLDKTDYSMEPFNGNFRAFAIHKIAVYQCYECNKPYAAGLKDWGGPNIKKEDCLWDEWARIKLGPIKGVSNCDIHGTEFLVFKCKYCWSEALFFWWNETHFCGPCHEKQEEDPNFEKTPPEELDQCGGYKNCPLGVDHPRNGTEEFSIKWSACQL